VPGSAETGETGANHDHTVVTHGLSPDDSVSVSQTLKIMLHYPLQHNNMIFLMVFFRGNSSYAEECAINKKNPVSRGIA
jgi:hypothetical protein